MVWGAIFSPLILWFKEQYPIHGLGLKEHYSIPWFCDLSRICSPFGFMVWGAIFSPLILWFKEQYPIHGLGLKEHYSIPWFCDLSRICSPFGFMVWGAIFSPLILWFQGRCARGWWGWRCPGTVCSGTPSTQPHGWSPTVYVSSYK